jgi:hypothetical protein
MRCTFSLFANCVMFSGTGAGACAERAGRGHGLQLALRGRPLRPPLRAQGPRHPPV